jgi:cob(I)alamin adenosyltransferase
MTVARGIGLVHVITGPGKGKTTAAFGLAMRAAGHGLRVCVIQFMKTGHTTGEFASAERLGVKVVQFGTGKFIGRSGPTAEDMAAAAEAIAEARRILSAGGCDLMVLDEVNTAAHLGLVTVSDVLSAVRSRGQGVEVVMTGRNAPAEFLESADYVSSIDNLKHPYDKGQQAREGIEW